MGRVKVTVRVREALDKDESLRIGAAPESPCDLVRSLPIGRCGLLVKASFLINRSRQHLICFFLEEDYYFF